MRTWIYLKDVDVFYQGMVESRRALFAEHGLTGDTHFIASTGIEGACAHRYDLVAMDAYSNLDLAPRQISYLNDFDRLCPTKELQRHISSAARASPMPTARIISSRARPASIRTGRSSIRGDVLRQLDHALDNVEALLRSGGASLADLMHLIVYLRDPTDFARIERLSRRALRRTCR